MIVYPEPEKLKSDEDDKEADSDCKVVKTFLQDTVLSQCSEIKWFRNFYKISVPLPIVETDTKGGDKLSPPLVAKMKSVHHPNS